jgi:ABC-2 type transport system permease protein
MNAPSDAADSSPASRAAAPAALSATRPLYWSVRRELWENRSIYMAGLVVSGVVLFGFSITTIHLTDRVRSVLPLDPAQQHKAIDHPYTIAAIALMVTAFLAAVFYCLDALHSERRDRSILFWKSLPVSDLTTVLAKVIIPLVVLPLITFVIIEATQLVMLLVSSAVLLAGGLDAAILWEQVKFLHSSVAQLYAVAVLALWHAPVYAWLLLVSGWARRAAFLWAVLPLLAIGVVEKIAFRTSHTAAMLQHRLVGWVHEAFIFQNQDLPVDPLAQIDPIRFLVSPGLWQGLAVAAALLAAAVRLRRYRQPI